MAVVFEPDKSGSASLIVGMGIKIEKKMGMGQVR